MKGRRKGGRNGRRKEERKAGRKEDGNDVKMVTLTRL
jgi:hypothetical protein